MQISFSNVLLGQSITNGLVPFSPGDDTSGVPFGEFCTASGMIVTALKLRMKYCKSSLHSFPKVATPIKLFGNKYSYERP